MREVKFVSLNDRAVLLSLKEAAQEIADKMALLREVLKVDALVRLSETHQQLDSALSEVEPEEYELIGTIDGTYGGRWMLAAFAENAAAAWPDGTAIYVKRVKR